MSSQKGLEPAYLIAQIAQRADETAFRNLFESYAPKVKAYFLRLKMSEEIAEELAQETLLTVWRKAHQFDGERSTGPGWIFAIARNLRVDHLRRPSSSQPPPMAANHDELSLDEHLSLRQREELMRRAIAALSHDEAAVLRQHAFDDRSHAQIAKALNLPLGTVKTRLRRALRRLRSSMDDSA
jgi:RNA polymerase sigma-70 factor (ECF subfamily)